MFKCIGGRCEDNCCIGWDVDIDQKTFLKYQKVDHVMMKDLFKNHIHQNVRCDQPHINYAFATLTSEKKCSFLDEQHLCKIQKNLGAAYLSNVCATFPRIANQIDDEIEHSATVSCPEIARLLLRHDDALVWDTEHKKVKPPIITYRIDQKNKNFQGTPLSNLKRTRDRCLELILNKRDSFENRLKNLAEFVVTLEKHSVQEKKVVYSFDEMSQMVVNALGKSGTSDSKRFNQFLRLAENGDLTSGKPNYSLFIQSQPQILPNLFGNHIVKNLFPFSEGENTMDALKLLLCRYFIIKRHFILLASQDLLDIDSAVAYLQSFSKVIEHHKYFETNMLETLRKNSISVHVLLKSLSVI